MTDKNRPYFWQPRSVATLWVDWTAGRAVNDNGHVVRIYPQEDRQKPNLTDLLDAAHAARAGRVMLTGKLPQSTSKGHWLIRRTPGWAANGHWLRDPIAGRFKHQATEHKVEIRLVREWFGTDALTPAQAQMAWAVTEAALGDAINFEGKKGHIRACLFMSPAATGANAWAMSFPQKTKFEYSDPEISKLIHPTAGQHRQEHTTTGRSQCDCGDCIPMIDIAEQPTTDTFAYIDGRYMYSSLCRELGNGPGRLVGHDEAAHIYFNEPYTRYRARVSVEVPAGWNHVGLLPLAHEVADDGWHYPNRPGARFETWADGSELYIAQQHGWIIHPLEAIVWEKGRVLDTFADRMIRARDRVIANQSVDAEVRIAVGTALRQIFIQTIGNFASRQRAHTVVVWSMADIPPEVVRTGAFKEEGASYVYEVPGREDPTTRPYYQPHLAAQVWGRGRARILEGRSGVPGVSSGALSLPPKSVIGIYGDAIYSTTVPAWARPFAEGGADDGKVGRLRLKGVLAGTRPIPSTTLDRNVLREQAERAGAGSDL